MKTSSPTSGNPQLVLNPDLLQALRFLEDLSSPYFYKCVLFLVILINLF